MRRQHGRLFPLGILSFFLGAIPLMPPWVNSPLCEEGEEWWR